MLMGGIVAEGAGTSISKEVQATIDAVATATVGMPADDGATADKIAKLLKLDKSSAWRRLRVASTKGYIVNLETRKGQPGRYRVTTQEVEAEELLPAPEAVKDEVSGAVQPVQPCNPTRNRQVFEELSDCTTGCAVAPVACPPAQVAEVIDVAFEGPLLEVTPKGARAALAMELAEANETFLKKRTA
jgi:hypothetical protein